MPEDPCPLTGITQRTAPTGRFVCPRDLETLLVSSVRYALGRQTYVVGDTCRIVRSLLSGAGPMARVVITRDVRAAVVHRQTGAACDHDDWAALLVWLDDTTPRAGDGEKP